MEKQTHMDIKTEQRDGISVVHLLGELTGETPLKSTVGRLTDQDRSLIVLDMSALTYINSAGLGDLVQMTARSNSQGGRLIIVSPSPFVAGVFEATKLDKFFEIHPNLDSAIA